MGEWNSEDVVFKNTKIFCFLLDSFISIIGFIKGTISELFFFFFFWPESIRVLTTRLKGQTYFFILAWRLFYVFCFILNCCLEMNKENREVWLLLFSSICHPFWKMIMQWLCCKKILKPSHIRVCREIWRQNKLMRVYWWDSITLKVDDYWNLLISHIKPKWSVDTFLSVTLIVTGNMIKPSASMS